MQILTPAPTATIAAELYSRAHAGDRFFKNHAETLATKERYLATKTSETQSTIVTIEAWMYVSFVFAFLQLLWMVPYPAKIDTYNILKLFFFAVLLPVSFSLWINGFSDDPLMKLYAEQLADPQKAYFIFCADRLYRTQDEIEFLMRPFPHVCAVAASLTRAYQLLDSHLRYRSSAIEIGLCNEPTYWNDDLQAMHHVTRELDRITRGIDYVISNSASASEQDRLCAASKLRDICLGLTSYILRSSLIRHLPSQSLFVLPYPIDVRTGEYVGQKPAHQLPYRTLTHPS
jgi:hypothetical protein